MTLVVLCVWPKILVPLQKSEEMTEEQKAAERAKPVSSTPVPGTPW